LRWQPQQPQQQQFLPLLDLDTPIVFFHDEANSLQNALKHIPLPLDYVEMLLGLSSTSSTPVREAIGQEPQGCLFYLLLVVNKWKPKIGAVHILCGTSMTNTEGLLSNYSPAQGMYQCVELDTTITINEMKEFLKEKLHPSIYNKIGMDERLFRLQGRPLFFSFLLHSIYINSPDPVGMAIERAFTEAKSRINCLWFRTDIDEVMVGVYWLFKMQALANGYVTVTNLTEVLKDLIARGILNCKTTTDRIKLDDEPITTAAILEVGDTAIRKTKIDKVMKMLDNHDNGIMSHDGDKGQGLENRFNWHLIKCCMQNDHPVTLFDICEPFLPPNYLSSVDVDQLQETCVYVRHAKKCNSSETLSGEGCFLNHLVDLEQNIDPTLLLWSTPTISGGADRVFIGWDKTTPSTLRLILMQDKNRLGNSDLASALDSLNLGLWYPDQSKKETSNHKSFRDFCLRHPQLLSSPIRIVLHAKEFTLPWLRTVTYYNMLINPTSPVFMLTWDLKSVLAKQTISSRIRGSSQCIDKLYLHQIRHWNNTTTTTQIPNPVIPVTLLPIPSDISIVVKIWPQGVSAGNTEESKIKSELLTDVHSIRSSCHGLLRKYALKIECRSISVAIDLFIKYSPYAKFSKEVQEKDSDEV